MALTKADCEILDRFNEMSDVQKEQFTEMTRLVGLPRDSPSTRHESPIFTSTSRDILLASWLSPN